jgi:ribosome recycling factor
MKGQGADLAGLAKRMDGALDVLRKELQGLRTGRASANLLEPITVEAYGSEVPLTQVATVNVPEPRMLTVQVWDRSMVKAVEKAIRSSNLGLNPATDGQLLRVPLPELSQERRQELVKVAHRYGEQARVAIRNVRRDGMDHLKQDEKKHEISEDERKRGETEVQKMTDETIGEIDAVLAAKDKEILQR